VSANIVNTAGLPGDRPSVRPGHVGVRLVAFDAPWDWLGAGWRDLWEAPAIGLTYGAAFSLGAVFLAAGLLQFGMQSLILALAGGFLLLGPLLGVGLYDVSRRLERGDAPSLSASLMAGFAAPGQLGFCGAVLGFLFFAWLQIAFLLFMMFLGSRGLPPAAEFLPTLLFTPHGLGLLVVGTAVGALLALAVFSIAVVSVPLMLVRRIDAITAMSVSIQAVIRNPKPMLLWAALIAAFMALGLATMAVGLVVAFPLIGHATWHAFRDVVVVDGTD
jgi:uncharacterized membrane protein